MSMFRYCVASALELGKLAVELRKLSLCCLAAPVALACSWLQILSKTNETSPDHSQLHRFSTLPTQNQPYAQRGVCAGPDGQKR